MRNFSLHILLLLTVIATVALIIGVLLSFRNSRSVELSPSQVLDNPTKSIEPTDPIYRWPSSTSTALFLTQVNRASNVLIIDVVNSTALMPLQRTMLVMEATRISAFNIEVLLTVTAYYRTPESLRTAEPTPELAIQPTLKFPEALVLELTRTAQP